MSILLFIEPSPSTSVGEAALAVAGLSLGLVLLVAILRK